MHNKFIDANRIPYSPTRFLSFDDVEIVPQFNSLTGSDDPQISLTTRLGRFFLLQTPVVELGDIKTCKDISSIGGLGVLKTYTHTNVDSFIKDIVELQSHNCKIAFTIGVHPDDEKLVQLVLDAGIKTPLVVISSPLAESQSCVEQIRRLDLKYKNLIDIGVDYLQTPVGIMKMVSAGATVIFVYSKFGASTTIEARRVLYGLQSNCTLISIIPNSDELGKAMVCGADIVCTRDANNVSYKHSIRSAYYLCGAKNSEEAFNRGLLIENTSIVR